MKTAKGATQAGHIEHMCRLIYSAETGTPEAFAKNLGISRSYLYTLLKVLKQSGAHVRYSRKNETFFMKMTLTNKRMF